MYKIGLIGLGAVGRFYARNLLKAYKQILIFDKEKDRMKEFYELGASPCESPKAIAEGSDIVILSLPSPEAVEAVLIGSQGLLSSVKKDYIIADLSTIDPDTSTKMAKSAARKGVYYLDAPISGGQPAGGGTEGAKKGTVTFMVGGDRKAFDKCKPVLSKLGKKFFYLGASGMGSTVKLLSNLVNGIENLIVAEAFTLGAKAGVDPKVLMKVFDETDADSYFLQQYLKPRFMKKDFEPGFTVDLQYKDHRLASELAKKLGVPLLFNELTVQIYQMLRAQGLGQKDYTAAVPFWAQLAKIDLYDIKRKNKS